MQNKAVAATGRTIDAIRKADRLPRNLLSPQKGRKGVSYVSRSSNTGTPLYLCEIIEDKGFGCYEVKVFDDPLNESNYTNALLTAFDMSFNDMFRAGDRLVAAKMQLKASPIAP
jgi:hypothetical protein